MTLECNPAKARCQSAVDPNPRKATARRRLTSSVQDRKLPHTCSWTRSLTEVNIKGYREKCRLSGIYNSNNYKATTENNNTALPTVSSSSSTLVCPSKANKQSHKQTDKQTHRQTKLRDLYNVVYGDQKSKPTIRISIDGIPGSAQPTVRLVLKSTDKVTNEDFTRVHKELININTNQNKRGISKDDTASSNRGRVNFEGASTPFVLKKLDKLKQDPKEKTRKWLHENPVGIPEVTQDTGPEWDIYNPVVTTGKVVRFLDDNEEYS